MNNYLNPYKGYIGSCEVLLDEGCLYGAVQGISGLIEYRAATIPTLEKEFHASVDAYLEMCEEFGEVPEKPFNGKVLWRTSPELHQKVYMRAKAEGLSMNAFVTTVMEKHMHAAERVAVGVARTASTPTCPEWERTLDSLLNQTGKMEPATWDNEVLQ